VSHSNTVPDRVRMFGGAPGADVADNEFDRLYQLIRGADGTITTVPLTAPPLPGRRSSQDNGMQAIPLRLHPGEDLRAALEAQLTGHGAGAAFVLQGIGSLCVAQLRLAGAAQPTELRGDLEILTLAGSVAPDGAHLHMSIADAQGRVMGGHVAAGCIVRTTAEVLLAVLPDHQFSRELDACGSGFRELVVRPNQQ
jgi:predicted DNA-binding protein with PD1-like motif